MGEVLDTDGRQVLADRVFRYGAPIEVMYAGLTVDQHHWLSLRPGEVEPTVLVARPFDHVVWSSFWPINPEDTIEFELSRLAPVGARQSWRERAADPEETYLRFRWFTASPPDERGIGITRQRLNEKFGGQLRLVAHRYAFADRYDDLDAFDVKDDLREQRGDQ